MSEDIEDNVINFCGKRVGFYCKVCGTPQKWNSVLKGVDNYVVDIEPCTHCINELADIKALALFPQPKEEEK